MIFRQLFDNVSITYTYILASRRGGEALIIDPVLEMVDRYLQLIAELDLCFGELQGMICPGEEPCETHAPVGERCLSEISTIQIQKVKGVAI